MIAFARIALVASASIAGLISARPAAAQVSAHEQESEPQAQGGIRDIIVTARKLSENLQNVPIAITALSGDQLKEQSVKTISDLQAQVPSLYLQQGADDPQSITILLRGRKQNDSSLAVDPSVGLYVDGLYIPRTIGLAGSLVDVNRVEVLRGPQGTLYGRNTTGGAISLITNDPGDTWSGSLDMTIGDYGTGNVVATANIPLTNNMAARFTGQRGFSNGYGRDLAGHKLLSENSQYYRVKIRMNWGGTWKAVLSAHYESNTSGGPILKLVGLTPADNATGLPEGGFLTLETAAVTGLSIPDAVNYLRSFIGKSQSDFYDNGATNKSFSHVWRADAALNITGDISDYLSLHSITGYQRLHRDEMFFSPIPVSFFTGNPITDDAYYSQELQLLGGANSKFSWVTGVYGGYEDGRDYTGTTLLPNVFGPDVAINDNQVRNTSLAAFAQAIWKFAPDWRLTIGGRYSRDKRRVDAIALAGGICVVPAPGVESTDSGPALCPRRFQNIFSKPSWLVSIDHQLSRDILLYAKVAQGYRSGGENESGSVDAASFASFAPETNIEYEAGLKSELLDRRLRLNVAGYHDRYSNLQVTTAFVNGSGGFGTAVTNAATATIWGIEAEADVVIAPGVRIHGSVANTHAKYGTFVDATGDRSSEPFTVPKWTASVSGRYAHSTKIGEIVVEADYDWRSRVIFDGSAVYRDQVTQDPVGLLNARLSLHLDHANMDLALFGKNLSSVKYYDQAFSLEFAGVNMAYATAPRTFGIEITKKFGS